MANSSIAADGSATQTALLPVATIGPTVYTSKLPMYRIEALDGAEEPEHSSNYIITVQITVISSNDITGSGNSPHYAQWLNYDNHITICGNLYEWLVTDSDATAASLSGDISGNDNEILIKDMRLASFAKGEHDDEKFEDIMLVEFYTYMTT